MKRLSELKPGDKVYYYWENDFFVNETTLVSFTVDEFGNATLKTDEKNFYDSYVCHDTELEWSDIECGECRLFADGDLAYSIARSRAKSMILNAIDSIINNEDNNNFAHEIIVEISKSLIIK